MISAPSNFNHISHMGPGDGIQIQRLMDLPTTLETADSQAAALIQQQQQQNLAMQQQQQQGMQRVRSMLQSSASRFSPQQRAYPEAPRRSLSHQGSMPGGQYNNGMSPPPAPGLPPRRPTVPPPMRPAQPNRSPPDHSDVSFVVA